MAALLLAAASLAPAAAAAVGYASGSDAACVDSGCNCRTRAGAPTPCGPSAQSCGPDFGPAAPQFHVRDRSCGENDPVRPAPHPSILPSPKQRRLAAERADV